MSFAVLGDTPYGTSPTDTTQLDQSPAFIAAIDADPDVSYVVHVGDIHSGTQCCTEDYDQGAAGDDDEDFGPFRWTRVARE